MSKNFLAFGDNGDFLDERSTMKINSGGSHLLRNNWKKNKLKERELWYEA